MATMNISLPDELRDFVDRQVAAGYSTSSEYVRELLRREHDKQKLRDLLMKGANSPPVGPADEAWFEGLRQHAVKHAKK
jgi:antitoxin ParD1/3/4